jgi:hypothetical protein
VQYRAGNKLDLIGKDNDFLKTSNDLAIKTMIDKWEECTEQASAPENKWSPD